jgi:hypothetical protein
MANGVAEACWLSQLPHELHALLTKSTLIYYDNVNTVYLSTHPIPHKRMKYVEIDLHIVQEHMAISDVQILHVLTTSQFTNIFMKGLPTSLFLEFGSSLNVRSGYSFDCRGGVL